MTWSIYGRRGFFWRGALECEPRFYHANAEQQVLQPPATKVAVEIIWGDNGLFVKTCRRGPRFVS